MLLSFAAGFASGFSPPPTRSRPTTIACGRLGPSSDFLNRREALQAAGGALVAAVAPQAALALGSEDKFDGPEDRFEAIRTAAAAAILTEKGSASVFSNKFGKLKLVDNKENFLFESKTLCPGDPATRGSNRDFTARLWKPIGTATAQDIVVALCVGRRSN